LNKLGSLLPKHFNNAPTKTSLDFDKAFSEINLIAMDLCPLCGGTGKLKAMQMAMTYDAGAVRYKDTTTKCSQCNGTGRK